MNTEIEYLMKIKTDDYAGNFERQCTAFATGQIGDCEVGSDEAQEFADLYGEDMFCDIIGDYNDEGCHRPCNIDFSETNSFFIYFKELPSDENIALIQKRVAEFFPSRNWTTKVLGFEVFKKTTTIDLELLTPPTEQ